ncbi:MAG TPA: DUF4124 domain-containing protein [Gammaproteobacteria bacterium]|nr:DUF4124 domain-containing protein [Gammaproteobacteria bacterium]
MHNVKFVLLVLSLFLFFSDASAKKKMYKWVDENGRITYSDKVPPEQIDKEHKELNEHGIVVEKVVDKEVENQLAEQKRQQEAEEKLAAEEEVKRQNILKAYTSEKEIERLKEERLFALKKNIESAQQNLEFQKNSREQLVSMAADSERKGQPVSDSLQSRIKAVDEKISYQIEFIETKKAEVSTVEEKFEEDLKMYNEAKYGK